MGQTAQKIISVNIDELLKMLNTAFCEEWLAYYQYWIGAHIAKGPARKPIAKEFFKHADSELEHAKLLAKRIIELGGTPTLSPDDWSKLALCKYATPNDEYVMALLKQNLTAERCAIGTYKKICDFCAGKDYQTFNVSRHILAEEEDHEQDIEDYIADIEATMEHACQCDK